ncbi:hypothetical protein PIB30_035443 [Stylosanthes scabra]|uniref:Uncharacterized protein n=1 Tax=Stylosanthes scabra TaxID=79078 RepID=A0ABU6TDD3_9FABA|nr:hypothetical protein [Stylosanthes scabra]
MEEIIVNSTGNNENQRTPCSTFNYPQGNEYHFRSHENGIITTRFTVLPAYPEASLYAGRILPEEIKYELQLARGVVFDLNRDLLGEGEKVIYQTTKPEVATQNSRFGAMVEDEASSIPMWY